MLSINDISKRLGISPRTIYRKLKQGAFPEPTKLSIRRIAWTEEQIDEWLAEQSPITITQQAFMPWYSADFHGATRGWPCCGRMLYRELLDAQWDLGSLPDNVSELRSLVAVDDHCWRKGWPYVEPKFPIAEDGKRYNKRLEQHRKK